MEENYGCLIAKSPVILELLEIIDRAAKTESSVLLTGESGVGKEIFAEQVHLRSDRKDKPFIRVNCASIPEGLLESELFGHVKGAFTDAVSSRHGRFEMADNGTIFLDEIGEMPLPVQAKILRVVQERKFEKVGSDETIIVNVRIVAATNKDLEKQVQNNLFREDLYYRLNILPVYIPPLRERPEDIMELADYFLKKINKNRNTQFEGFSTGAIGEMLSYSWPGNVRELQNSIERACIIAKNRQIEKEDLLFFKKQQDTSSSAARIQSRSFKSAVNAFKANYIKKVLDECGWNVTEASRVLDIQRTYLSKLIKELKITGHSPEEHKE